MSGGAGLVCGEIKVGVSHAEFYIDKHRVVTIEVSGLVFLS